MLSFFKKDKSIVLLIKIFFEKIINTFRKLKEISNLVAYTFVCVGRRASGKICEQIASIVLQEDEKDRWVWQFNLIKGYPVCSVNVYITSMNSNDMTVIIFDSKLSILKFHCLFGVCCLTVSCCLNHLFVRCDFFGRLWSLMTNWLVCRNNMP